MLVYYHPLIRQMYTLLTSVILLTLRTLVKLGTAQLVAQTTINICIHITQDSVTNPILEKDTSIMVGSTRRPTNLLVTHLELVHILSMQVHLLSLSGFQNSMVLVHLLFLVLVSRELQLQAATLHYSSLLVLLLQKDSLLRLQRIQFSTKFLALQARVLPKTSLVLDPLLSTRPTLLDLPHTEGSSFLLLLVLQPLQVTPQRNSVEIHQKVLIYTSSTERELPRDADLLQKLSTATLRLSGELNHPDIDFTPHYGIDRNIGIETGFTFSPGGISTKMEQDQVSLLPDIYLIILVMKVQLYSVVRLLVVPMLLSIPLVLSSLLVSELMFLRIMMVLSKSVLVKDSFLQLKLVVHSMTSPLLVLVLIDSIESSDTMVMIEILELQELSQSPPRRERPKKELSQSKVLVDSIKSVELHPTKQQHSPKLVLDPSTQCRVLQSLLLLPNSLLELKLWLVRQKNPSLLKLQKKLQQLLYLEQALLNAEQNTMVLEHLQYTIPKKLLLESESLSKYLVASVFCLVLRKQLESQEQQVRFLSILLVLQKQDTSKYSKTLFLLELSHYLENSLTQISITLHIHWIWKYYYQWCNYCQVPTKSCLRIRTIRYQWNCWRKICIFRRKYNSLQHRRRCFYKRDCSLPRLHSFWHFYFQ